ncbi:Hsp20/alpha crystallin family protein [Halomarina oriensis]|uniref:Hsp20 family protein n=1 Tax=Halomarina oriensis TaxID=671145 RepID=A0A6B0GTF0_9EURY|nr:Hsp20 family protein [Halomarina oriensis]MWG35415.1 Hsp20 family protein [Halomarina oriensis]
MFKELGERVESTVLEGIGRSSARWQERTPLKVDLLESDEAFLAVFDAPGVRREDVEVRFDENTLFVRIDRFREFYDDHDMRLPGRGLSLDGSVDLPTDATVDAREAEATVTQNGTLRVRIPKTETGREVTVDDESVPHDTDGDSTEEGSSDALGDTSVDTDDVGSANDAETGLDEEEIPDGPEDDAFEGPDDGEQ